ncbi:MAG TPA: anti-sigma factor [Thermoleophilaceae bacterium]|nr:anti-sigma factor [Thermoleophilaceae bacterium]
MASDHERYEEDLAPYLLSALTPVEAQELEQHLRGCASCREQLGRLRIGAEALARSVESLEPPASLRERILGEVAGERSEAPASEAGPVATPPARRRRIRSRRALIPSWRPALAVLGAGLLALAAGLGGWALGTDELDRRTVAGVVDGDRLPDVSAELTFASGDQDAVLRLTGLPDLGPQRTYEMWVERDGKLVPASLFNPTPSGVATTGISGNVEDVEAVYVTRERAGGARKPSESPVVSVPIS